MGEIIIEDRDKRIEQLKKEISAFREEYEKQVSKAISLCEDLKEVRKGLMNLMWFDDEGYKSLKERQEKIDQEGRDLQYVEMEDGVGSNLFTPNFVLSIGAIYFELRVLKEFMDNMAIIKFISAYQDKEK